jgi:hypothetical protein
MENVNLLEEKILSYFTDPAFKMLACLDMTTRKEYSGVTLQYVFKEVLKEEYSIDLVKETLIDLFNKNLINALYCGSVEDVVFEKLKSTPHWCFKKEHDVSLSYLNSDKSSYSRFLKQLNEKQNEVCN